MKTSVLGRLISAAAWRPAPCAVVVQCAVLAVAAAIPVGAWAAEPPAGPLLAPGDGPAAVPAAPPLAPEAARPDLAPAGAAPADAAGQPIEGEALTRGPIHEAYAEMVNYDPQPGPIAPKQPPPLVEELPPEEKPEGEGFVWISGYWWWDDERGDFIWLSGVWRRPPPGFTWVPGYWKQVAEEYQWVSGYWSADAAAAGQEAAAEVQYLPAPPRSLEVGPSSPQPTVEYFWSPGYWVWYESRYVWRVGRWMRGQEGWVWIPPHYVWTPCGYVYVPGHWDYTPEYRGLAFCPVYFGPALYVRVRPVFVPRVVILSSRLHVHLFCRPGWGHYYFGDYYDARYATLGFYPWFSVATARRGWDPLYAYHAWHFTRTDPAWPTKVRGWHDYVAAHPEARPPRTYTAMSTAIGPPGAGSSAALLAARLDHRPGGSPPPGLPLKLESIEPARAKQYLDLSSQFRRLAQDRAELEHRHGPAGVGGGASGAPRKLDAPRRLELPVGQSQRLMRELGVKPPDVAAGRAASELPGARKPESLVPPRHGLPRGETPGMATPEPRNPRLPKFDLPSPSGRSAGGEPSRGPLPSFQPPRGQTPQLPRLETPQPPKHETPQLPRLETPQPPKHETPQLPRLETPQPPKHETPQLPRLETPRGRLPLPTPQHPSSGIQPPNTGTRTPGGLNPPSRVTAPPVAPRIAPPAGPQTTPQITPPVAPPSRGRSRSPAAEILPIQPRTDVLPRPSIALPGAGPGAIEPFGARAAQTARAPAPSASGIMERGLGLSAGMASLLRDSQTLGRSAGRLPEAAPAPRANVAPVPSAVSGMAIQPGRLSAPIRAPVPTSPPLAGALASPPSGGGMNPSARPGPRAGALASPPVRSMPSAVPSPLVDPSRSLESLRAGRPARR